MNDLSALPVTTRAEGETFIRGLHALGLLPHFDDGAVDCLHGNGLVTLAEAGAIDAQVERCYRVWEASGADMDLDCPIAFALTLLNS